MNKNIKQYSPQQQEIIQQFTEWYSKKYILYEIVKTIQKREIVILNAKENQIKKLAVRGLFATNYDYLKKHLERFKLPENLYNLYISTAILEIPQFPIFNYNLKKRVKEIKYLKFNKLFDSYITGFDLFFDIDGKENFKKAYQQAKELKEILEKEKVPYYLLNSSFKGFHFIIPAEYIQFENVKKTIPILKEVVYNIKGIYNLSELDDSVVDSRRIRKTPYSCVGDGSIALPLSDTQFKNFKPEMVLIKNVLKSTKIFQRGLLTRTYGLPEQQLKENTQKFIKEYYGF